MTLSIINGWEEGHFKAVASKGLHGIEFCANDRYDTKVCLVARKVRPGESADVDVEHAVVNENRVKPSRY